MSLRSDSWSLTPGCSAPKLGACSCSCSYNLEVGRQGPTSGGFEVAGAGVYVPASELAFEGSVWGTAEEYGDARGERCRAFMPVPGVMQTVQRAEFWGAIIAMQAYLPCHVGIDNLIVARTLGRLLDHDSLAKPLPLVKDGDLVTLAQDMIRTRGRETVRVTEVKGQADDSGGSTW